MPHDPTLANMGRIHTTTLQRDAVHIAVVQMTSGADILRPGTRIGRDAQGRACRADEDDIEAIGIVDPYLLDAVARGERFFMFLFPGSITSLAHHWTHPAFAEYGGAVIPPVVEAPRATERVMVVQDRERAREILEDVAARAGTDFDDLMRAAERSGDYGHIILHTDNDIYDVPASFWPAWSTYTGQPIPNDAAEHFSCSC